MYLLFAGMKFYPDGGYEDYIKDFHRIEDAKAFVEADKGDDYQWAHIVESNSRKIVLKGTVIDSFALSYREFQGYEWEEPGDEN